MALYAFEETRPVVDPDAFVHPDAVLIGDVSIGKKCFIGAGAVLRGDFGKISIGDGRWIFRNLPRPNGSSSQAGFLPRTGS